MRLKGLPYKLHYKSRVPFAVRVVMLYELCKLMHCIFDVLWSAVQEARTMIWFSLGFPHLTPVTCFLAEF